MGPVCEARHPAAFADVRFGARMFTDHRPSVYSKALDDLQARAEAEQDGAPAAPPSVGPEEQSKAEEAGDEACSQEVLALALSLS